MLSPDGKTLASPSQDETVGLWDLENGRILHFLKHEDPVTMVAWSPDGNTLATAGVSTAVYLWDVGSGELIQVIGARHYGTVNCVSWISNDSLVFSLNDNKIRFFDITNKQKRDILVQSGTILNMVVSPDGKYISFVSNFKINLLDVETGKVIRQLQQNRGRIFDLAWSPNGKYIAWSSEDGTVQIWQPYGTIPVNTLEGHTSPVISVSFFDDGRFVVSFGKNRMVIIWRIDSFSEAMRIEKIGNAFIGGSLALHPTLPIIISPGFDYKKTFVWDFDLSYIRNDELDKTLVSYVNAKVVLLGDTLVGKTALGRRMKEGMFIPSESSTHGAQFWHFSINSLPGMPKNMHAELTLWDFAGQPEYRIIHQLFLDDIDAAIILFDCSDSDDPFRGVPYWAKVLKKQAPSHAVKFLVSSKCDVSPTTVDDLEINKNLALYELNKYFITSALTGIGVDILYQNILSCIPWDQLPRTNTPELFQIIRDFLLERKSAGQDIIIIGEILQNIRKRFSTRIPSYEEIIKVVSLLQSRGIVYQLKPKPGNIWVLLKPELINQYGSSIIISARNHPRGIGAVSERDVLIGNISFSGFGRLPHAKEILILEATVELLIQHDLCFREMGYLVFPSEINISRYASKKEHPKIEVAYQFSGSIETIYASLVVRLTHSEYFQREDQWKNVAEFSRDKKRLGFSLKQIEEGTGELGIYFYPGISDPDRILFIFFITDHLRTKGIHIQEQILLFCPNCSKEVKNRDAIRVRIENGHLDIPCQYCATNVLIPRSIEERYIKDPSLERKQQELITTIERRSEYEIVQFKTDKQQYEEKEDKSINILHLSDLHLESVSQAQIFRTQLESDLKKELKIGHLDYLVISGDVSGHSIEMEYSAAFSFVDGFVKHFGLNPDRIIIVPGNHDINWDISESSYELISKRKLPSGIPAEKCIDAGDAGTAVRNDEKYKERFSQFNNHFYHKIYSNSEYPQNYEQQTQIFERNEDNIFFLGLNSCWQIDHHFTNRVSINNTALALALEKLQDEKYNHWLKIMVCHHPPTGKEMLEDSFMEQLAVNGFQICLHGHIHESKENSFKYDKNREIRIIGAGTFGASAKEQVPGIPLQYNLLTLNPQNGEMIVHTRKKEKKDGSWSGDARWGDKNHPEPSYTFHIKNIQITD